jgi:hypothetical protein
MTRNRGNRGAGGARPGAAHGRIRAGGIDFRLSPRIFSGFLTGEVPFQGALPFICL